MKSEHAYIQIHQYNYEQCTYIEIKKYNKKKNQQSYLNNEKLNNCLPKSKINT